MRVLLVEDEPRIADDARDALAAAGYVVDIVGDGEEAWFRGDTEDYDLVVLDLGLPRLDGLTVLKRWREAGRRMPVLILTARGAWTERVDGIDAGADDYVVKPFRLEELVARARALIRRSAGHASARLAAGRVVVDTRQMRVHVDDRAIAVTPLEYRLVAYLAHHVDRVVPATELLEHLYGTEDGRDVNALEAAITRLRRKLGADAIETRRGLGYLMTSGGGDGTP